MKNKILGLSMIFSMGLALSASANDGDITAQVVATNGVDANGYVTLTTTPANGDKKPMPAELIQKWQKRGEELNKRLDDRAQNLVKKVDVKAEVAKDRLAEQKAKALDKGNDKRVGKIDERMKKVDEKAVEKKAQIEDRAADMKKKLGEVETKIGEKIAEKEVKFEIGSEVKFSGVVVENKILEATDALNSLTIKTSAGKTVNVAYSGGLLGCVNSKVATSARVIKAGQRVSVFAKVTSENSLSICGSETYSVNILPEAKGLPALQNIFKRLFGWFGR